MIKKLLFTFCLLFLVFLSHFTKVSAAENGNSLNLNEIYSLGEIIKFEQKGDIEYLLETPNGDTLYGYEFKLEEIGKYVLTKRVKTGNSYDIISDEFIVNEAFCDVTGESSSVSLEKKGLFVRLSEGDTATINKTLDMRNVTKNDELFKLEIIPTVKESANFTIITITFVDVEDPNCYLKVLLQNSPEGKWASYALAGATDQPLTGYEAELGRLHKNNQWGAYFPMNFYGMAGGNSVVDIRFNASTKEVYSIPNYRIIDLDDPDFFSNKWDGFISGKVKVKITASGYLKNTADFMITSYGNEKVTDIYATDNDGPNISVDVEDSDIPYGVVGKAYPLFDVKVNDEGSGVSKVIKSVYRNYNKTNEYNVSIDDNAFIPTETGVYTIEYKAFDKFGNYSVASVDVEVVDSIKPISLSIIKSSQITQGYLGESIKVADYYVSGGCGKVTVDVTVKFDGEEVELTDGMFRPEYEGTYDIIYSAIDYLGNQKVSVYNFTGVKTNTPYFAKDPVLPHYFINGKTYQLEELYGVDYSTGSRQDAKATIYLEVNGKRECVDEKEFTINTTSENVKVIYVVGDYELVKEIKVINVGEQDSLDLGKYFISEEATVSATEKGIYIGGNTDANVSFIKEVLALDFQVKFKLENASKLDSISIILTDSVNKEQSVKFTFKKYGDKSIFLINDKKLYDLAECGFTSKSQRNEFTLTSDGTYVSPFGSISLTINTYMNQEEFVGFSSNLVYVDIVTSGATGEYELYLNNLSGQPLNNTNKDRIKPLIVINGKYGGEYNVNETVVLNPAIACDVLDPNLQFTLSVLKPDGSYVLDKNGVEMNGVDPTQMYEFVTSAYGYYNVIYTARDTNNKQDKTFSYSIICEDKIKPNVNFTVVEQAKVNEKISIKDLSYSDNYSSNDKLQVYAYVVLPGGENILMKNGYYSFTPKHAGIYKVVIYVYDESFNIGMKEVTIKVVE